MSTIHILLITVNFISITASVWVKIAQRQGYQANPIKPQ